jgi:hypothetical protein
MELWDVCLALVPRAADEVLGGVVDRDGVRGLEGARGAVNVAEPAIEGKKIRIDRPCYC